MRNKCTPCYHVIENRRAICGTPTAFWQAIVLYSGKIAAWDPSHVGFAGGIAKALPEDMICGRCLRIVKNKRAKEAKYRAEAVGRAVLAVFDEAGEHGEINGGDLVELIGRVDT